MKRLVILALLLACSAAHAWAQAPAFRSEAHAGNSSGNSLTITKPAGVVQDASTDVPYAAAHQFGLPQRNLPARPFLLLTDSDREEVIRTILASLSDGHIQFGRGSQHPPL